MIPVSWNVTNCFVLFCLGKVRWKNHRSTTSYRNTNAGPKIRRFPLDAVYRLFFAHFLDAPAWSKASKNWVLCKIFIEFCLYGDFRRFFHEFWVNFQIFFAFLGFWSSFGHFFSTEFRKIFEFWSNFAVEFFAKWAKKKLAICTKNIIWRLLERQTLFLVQYSCCCFYKCVLCACTMV